MCFRYFLICSKLKTHKEYRHLELKFSSILTANIFLSIFRGEQFQMFIIYKQLKKI